MSKIHKIKTPLTDDIIKELRIGDTVYLSGIIYTARDAAHKKLVELLEKGEKLPFDLKGAVIYYVGPSPAKPGMPIGSAGPTTSYRMDPYTPILLRNGLKACIGKGNRGQDVVNSLIENKGVYLAAIGGAAALIAKTIKNAEVIAYEELKAEAIRKLTVEDFPCTVANDMYGDDLYKKGVEEFLKTKK